MRCALVRWNVGMYEYEYLMTRHDAHIPQDIFYSLLNNTKQTLSIYIYIYYYSQYPTPKHIRKNTHRNIFQDQLKVTTLDFFVGPPPTVVLLLVDDDDLPLA